MDYLNLLLLSASDRLYRQTRYSPASSLSLLCIDERAEDLHEEALAIVAPMLRASLAGGGSHPKPGQLCADRLGTVEQRCLHLVLESHQLPGTNTDQQQDCFEKAFGALEAEE